jgi:hypothetical protein
MPRIIHCAVLPELGNRLRPGLDLPKWAMFIHGRNNEEGGILLNIILREFSVGVNRLGIVICEIALQ